MYVEPLPIATAMSRHSPGTVEVTIASDLPTAIVPVLREALQALDGPASWSAT